MVGDPSGKRTERPVLSVEEIDRNVAGDPRPARALRLASRGRTRRACATTPTGSAPLGLMEFLRDVGKHFTVNYMLAKDSVKGRMEAGHLLHRVLLPAGPGLRLLAPVEDRALRAADGRQRPVGQHHRRHRAHLAQGGAGGPGPHLPAPHHRLGRRSSARPRAARCGSTRPGRRPTSSSSSGSTPTTATSSGCSSFFTFLPLEEIAALLAEQAKDPGKRAAQRALAEDMTAAHPRGGRRRGAWSRRAGSCSARRTSRRPAPTCSRCSPASSRPRRSRAPSSAGSRSSTPSCAPGSRRRRATRGAASRARRSP